MPCRLRLLSTGQDCQIARAALQMQHYPGRVPSMLLIHAIAGFACFPSNGHVGTTADTLPTPCVGTEDGYGLAQ